MSGNGKYTTYVPVSSARKSYMEKLFKGFPFAGMSQADAITSPNGPVALGNNYLRAIATNGVIDTNTLSLGKVDLTFLGRESPIQAPDTHEGKDVKWRKSGDPANSYMPDVTSPGPGKTAGVDKNVDPQIKTTDIKPTFDPARTSVNTLSPSEAGSRVYDASLFGKEIPLGKSS